jgi:hypothetical protein
MTFLPNFENPNSKLAHKPDRQIPHFQFPDLALPLLVLRVLADDPNYTVAPDDFALGTDFAY